MRNLITISPKRPVLFVFCEFDIFLMKLRKFMSCISDPLTNKHIIVFLFSRFRVTSASVTDKYERYWRKASGVLLSAMNRRTNWIRNESYKSCEKMFSIIKNLGSIEKYPRLLSSRKILKKVDRYYDTEVRKLFL